MTNQEIALLTELIWNKLADDSNLIYPKNFKGVLYLFLQINEHGDIEDDNYQSNGYPGDYTGWHRYRASLNNANRNGLSIASFEVKKESLNNTCIWQIVYSNGSSKEFFLNTISLDNHTITKWLELELFEIADLFQFRSDLIDLFNSDCKEESIETDSHSESDHDFDSRYKAFYSIYERMLPIYPQLNDQEKSFIEVSLGASLFYLPQKVNASWSGQVSKTLLYDSITDQETPNRFVKDHIYSRKRAAKDLLNNWCSFEEFCERYDSIYRKFSYVTYNENMLLVNWHEDSNSYEEAILKKEIYLINLKLMGIEHNQRNKFLEYCRNISEIDWSSDNHTFERQLNSVVNEFLNR